MRSRWNTPTAASDRPMKRRQADTSSNERAERSAGGRQAGSPASVVSPPPPVGVPPPSAPREASVAGLAGGSGEGHGDWRLKGFSAPKGANRL